MCYFNARNLLFMSLIPRVELLRDIRVTASQPEVDRTISGLRGPSMKLGRKNGFTRHAATPID